eukprot:15365446-Ditylum_brightwellii.AAC.1
MGKRFPNGIHTSSKGSSFAGDQVLNGYHPELQPEWLSDAELQQRRCNQCQYGHELMRFPHLGSNNPRVDTRSAADGCTTNEINAPLDMSVLEGASVNNEPLSCDSDTDDDAENVDSPERRYLYCTNRGRLPPQYSKYPYVVGAADHLDAEDVREYADVFLASYLTRLPPFQVIAPEQLNCQVCQMEALHRLEENDRYVNGVHPLAFAA